MAITGSRIEKPRLAPKDLTPEEATAQLCSIAENLHAVTLHSPREVQTHLEEQLARLGFGSIPVMLTANVHTDVDNVIGRTPLGQGFELNTQDFYGQMQFVRNMGVILLLFSQNDRPHWRSR